MKKIVSLIMAVIMIAGICTTGASAVSDIHLDIGEAVIYKDDRKVSGIDAYLDGFGEIRVSNESDICKIFADELDGVVRLPLTTLIVTGWADYYGYAWSQSGNTLYIYTGTLDLIEGDELIYNPDSSGPADPTTNGKVYVNGIYRSNLSGVTTYGGEAFISSYATLKAIFPTEAAKVNTSAYMPTSSLRMWATQYKYSMVVSDNRVYLNNDGKTPIEMTLDGVLIDFPDQQPFVVAPGRTMIPIATFSENLGFKVTWEGKVSATSTYDRVKMEYNGKTLYLWIGSNQYWIGGKYYTMDVAPYVTNGRTMVPVYFIAEALGYTVKWDPSTQPSTVRVTSK